MEPWSVPYISMLKVTVLFIQLGGIVITVNLRIAPRYISHIITINSRYFLTSRHFGFRDVVCNVVPSSVYWNWLVDMICLDTCYLTLARPVSLIFTHRMETLFQYVNCFPH